MDRKKGRMPELSEKDKKEGKLPKERGVERKGGVKDRYEQRRKEEEGRGQS